MVRNTWLPGAFAASTGWRVHARFVGVFPFFGVSGIRDVRECKTLVCKVCWWIMAIGDVNFYWLRRRRARIRTWPQDPHGGQSVGSCGPGQHGSASNGLADIAVGSRHGCGIELGDGGSHCEAVSAGGDFWQRERIKGCCYCKFNAKDREKCKACCEPRVCHSGGRASSRKAKFECTGKDEIANGGAGASKVKGVRTGAEPSGKRRESRRF